MRIACFFPLTTFFCPSQGSRCKDDGTSCAEGAEAGTSNLLALSSSPPRSVTNRTHYEEFRLHAKPTTSGSHVGSHHLFLHDDVYIQIPCQSESVEAQQSWLLNHLWRIGRRYGVSDNVTSRNS